MGYGLVAFVYSFEKLKSVGMANRKYRNWADMNYNKYHKGKMGPQKNLYLGCRDHKLKGRVNRDRRGYKWERGRNRHRRCKSWDRRVYH